MIKKYTFFLTDQRRLSLALLMASVAWLAHSTPAVAQLTITTDTTQNGGTLTVSPMGNLRIENFNTSPLLTLTNGATTSGVEDLMVGSRFSTSGRLQIENGSTAISEGGFVGFLTDSFGEATVTGNGSRWDLQSFLEVGAAGGEGMLNITNSGFVTSPLGAIGTAGINGTGSRGTVNIIGSGSRWEITEFTSQSGYGGRLDIGRSAQGELNILNGATAAVANSVRLGTIDSNDNTAGSGTATVSGVGSRWDIGNDQQGGALDIGVEAEGIVNITNGAVVNHTGRSFNDGVYLGGSDSPSSYGSSGGSGTLTISGSGSQLNSDRELHVGFDGSGTLNISNGGSAIARTTRIGRRAGSTGSVTVSGAGSILDMSPFGDIDVGVQGDGSLTIEQGGLAKASFIEIAAYPGSSGQVAVTDAGSRFDTEYLSIGREGTGTLTISGGGSVTVRSDDYSASLIGYFTGSSGIATVTGVGSRWETAGPLFVGDEGDGTLIVSDGGEVVAETIYASASNLFGNSTIAAKGVVLGGYDLVFDSTHGLQQTHSFGNGGQLNFDLDGSGDLGIGHKESSGTLAITEGVIVASKSGIVGNYESASTSTAIVDGSGTQWLNSEYIGISNGTLNITNGALVTSTSGYIDENSSATITGTDSKWIMSKPANSDFYSSAVLTVNGSLTVTDGGEVVANTLWADLSNLNGNGTISAKGAVLGGGNLVFDSTHGLQQTLSFGNGGQLHLDFDGSGALGVYGDGTITIADGVKVVSTQASLGDYEGGSGTATVTGIGSTWEITQYLSVGGDNYFGTGGIGMLIVQDGATVSVGEGIYVEETGSISGNGGTILGDVFNNGTIAPGNSPGTLSIDGNLDNTGILQFEIASLSDFDQLNISGELSAGGTIEVTLLGGYSPVPGNTFDLVNFWSFFDTGYAFDFSLAELENTAWTWDTSNFATNGTVTVIAIPEPSSIVLILTAFLGLTFAHRKRMRHQQAIFGLVITASLIGVSSQATLHAATFQGLGDLPGGNIVSSASGISADGLVVFGTSLSASGFEAFRWSSNDGIDGLGDLSGGNFSSSIGYILAGGGAVSADGSVSVGTGNSAAGQEAFQWSSNGGMVGLGDLPGGAFGSVAAGVSADGTVVVGYGQSASGNEAFRWTNSDGMVGLGSFPGGILFDSAATGVSADGTVVVGYSESASGREAFRWTNTDGMVGLGDLPGGIFASSARHISADGSVIVGQSNSTLGFEAFRWTDSGGMVGLGMLNLLDSSEAKDASANGSVIVGSSFSVQGSQAFLWDENQGMRDLRTLLTDDYGLDLTGWTLTSATGISDNGNRIVGWGTNPVGYEEAWLVDLATTVPEPSTAILAGSVLAAFSMRRTRFKPLL